MTIKFLEQHIAYCGLQDAARNFNKAASTFGIKYLQIMKPKNFVNSRPEVPNGK